MPNLKLESQELKKDISLFGNRLTSEVNQILKRIKEDKTVYSYQSTAYQLFCEKVTRLALIQEICDKDGNLHK